MCTCSEINNDVQFLNNNDVSWTICQQFQTISISVLQLLRRLMILPQTIE